MLHFCMMPHGPILMTKPKPQIVFGLWLDRPGHQDGALGHHAGVLHDSPGYLFEIMQDIPQFAYESVVITY